MKNLAIIPARGGSKRILHKNIKPFMGKPIITYSIEAALESGLFDEVMVSTDDWEIAEIARQYGAKVPFMRTEMTSGDYASTVDVLLEVIREYESIDMYFDHACCIYATAPFLSIEKLKEAFSLLLQNELDSVFTSVEYSYPIQRALKMVDGKIRMISPENLEVRSQDLEKTYHDAGQLYVFNVEAFKKQKKLWTDNSGTIVLSELQVQDLDTLTDWKLAEMKYQLLKNK